MSGTVAAMGGMTMTDIVRDNGVVRVSWHKFDPAKHTPPMPRQGWSLPGGYVTDNKQLANRVADILSASYQHNRRRIDEFRAAAHNYAQRRKADAT